MIKYINVDDLKDKLLLEAVKKNHLSIKEIYDLVNNMPTVVFIDK